MRNRHGGHRGGGLPLFFEGRSSCLGRSRRVPPVANPPSMPSSDKEVHSDDKIFCEIEDYAVEAEKEDHVQAGDPYLYVLASDVWWSEGGSSFSGAGPSTSGASLVDSSF